MKCKNVLCKEWRGWSPNGCRAYQLAFVDGQQNHLLKDCDKRKLFNRVEARLPTHTIYVPDVESIRPMLIKARAEG